MMKRLVLLLGALTAAHSLSAFDGFYIGGAGGVSATQGRQEGNAEGAFANPAGSPPYLFYPADLSTDILSGTGAGMLYAGYGMHWSYLYAGLEAFAQYSNDRLNKTRENLSYFPAEPAAYDTIDHTTVEIGPWHCGLDARPGLLLSDRTLLYGRVGFSYERLKLGTNAANVGPTFNEFFDIPVSGAVHKKGAFLRLGAGLEQHLSQHVTLRADYIFTDYRTLSFEGSNSGVSTPGGTYGLFLNDSKNVHLKNHTLLLGLSYYLSSCPLISEYNFCEENFSGFYVAGNAGGALTDCNPQGNLVNMSPGITFGNPGFHTYSPATQLTENDFRGSLFAGYGWQCGWFYAGLEGFVQYSPYSRKKVDNNIHINLADYETYNRVTTTAKIDPWQFGIEARPGFLLSPLTLFYGTIGTSCARIKASSDASYSDPLLGTSLFVTLTNHSTRATLRAGAGIEHALGCGWHIRADYLYTNYGSLSMKGFASAFNPTIDLVTLSDDTKIRLVNHALTLGLSWYL